MDTVRVTKVVLRPISMNKVCALASIVLDDAFAVHDLRVVDGDRGPFVAMPSLKRPNGEFRDICHPVNTETRNEIQRAVLEQFAREGGAAAFRQGVSPASGSSGTAE
jgi:stage V sporulation protein G